MAVTIDNVYQKVLAICNKEQRGYITPQEFNLFADKAQNEIFSNYFHSIKTAEVKPKNQMLYSDEVELAEKKLHPFYTTTTVSTSNSSLAIPTNIYDLVSIQAVSSVRGSLNKLTQLNKSEVEYTENNPLTKASLSRSVFVRETSNNVTIFPAPSTETYNIDTSNPLDGVLDAESFRVNFYRAPVTPNWAYVVTGEKALWNSGASTNFELHESEEENLVSRILMIAGVSIQKPDIQQAGVTDINMARQQQNS